MEISWLIAFALFKNFKNNEIQKNKKLKRNKTPFM